MIISTRFKNLASFQNCKQPPHHSIITLSRLGFEFVPSTGLVQCSHCSYNVTESTLPIELISSEHAKWGPSCPYNGANKFLDQTEFESCVESIRNTRKAESKKVSQSIPDKQREFENLKRQGQLGGKDDVDSGINSSRSVSSTNPGDTMSTISSTQSNEKSDIAFSTLSDISFTKSTESPDSCSSSALEKLFNNIDLILKKSKDETDLQDSRNCSSQNKDVSAKSRDDARDEEYLMKHAKHPIMASTEERRESFRGQEKKYKHCERATVETFVVAGMFYVGPEDNVRCFFCDGGLRNIQSHNDPHEEHKRWFPECRLVIYLEERMKDKKGFRTSNLDRDDAATASSRNSMAGIDPTFKIPGRALEAREVKARMETTLVQRLLSQGFQREYIKRAIERRFILHGDDFKSAQDLVRDILDIEGDNALPRPGQIKSSNQDSAVQNPDMVDGASAVRTCATATSSKLLGKGKDLLAAELDRPVSEAVRALKHADVQNALKNQTIEDEELKRQWDEYQELSQVRTCKICLDREINTVFLPCGHYVTCDKCCPKISHCCICRALIRGTVLALSATSSNNDAGKAD